jgi:epoxide hydrolase-like predicted phosphatase
MLYFQKNQEKIMSNKIKTVIWDMGGVFLRSEDWTPRRELAVQYGMTLDEIHEFIFNSVSGKLATLGKIEEEAHWRDIGGQLRISSETLKEFREQFWAGDSLDYELTDFIRKLKPDYTTGLLSNAWTNARHVLTRSKPCIDAFHVAVFSCEVGLAKPDPSIYNLVLRLCSTEPEEAIFVDDFVENIEAANQLGIHGILFKNAKQAMADVKAMLSDGGAR